MDEFEVIVIMNEAKIRLSKDKNKDTNNNLFIKKYLEHRDCFFKIDKSMAQKILLSVGVNKEQIDIVYEKLTCKSMFYNLLNKGIINENDKGLVINYTKKGV